MALVMALPFANPTTDISQKRQRESSEDRDLYGHGDGDGPFVDDDEALGEKPGKIDESKLLWFTQELTVKAMENPSISENCRLLSHYAKNVSRVKQYVQLAVTAPPGVPSSEIENALHGQAINLDAIFTALHHT